MTSWWVRTSALGAAALLALTACSAEPSHTADAEPSFASPAKAVPGCAAKAHVDPSDRTRDRPVARCAARTPEPIPLPKKTTVQVTAQTKGEYYAPLLLGMAKGEFAKENLDVKLSIVSFADSLPQLSSGSLDIAFGGPYASVVNAVHGGFDLRWVLGNFVPSHGGDVATRQSGLWFRRDAFTDPGHPTLATLKNKKPTVANTQGSGTPAAFWLDKAFRKGGIDYNDVKFESLSPADQVTALRSGAVQGAYLLDPYWRELAGDRSFVQLAVQPREVNGGAFFGPNLLEKNPEAGLAFARAYIRTINTYLTGDYKKDQGTVRTLARRIGVGDDVIRRGAPLLFDWQVPHGLYTDLEKLYIRTGSVKNMKTPLPERRLVNRDFYDRAVGHGAS